MPERGFDTGFWNDPFVQKLPQEGKTLFAYLWTNDHCNPAGLYEITPKTIAFDTGLSPADIPALLESLKPKVVWYPDENLVWVKNFIKRQSKSSKFLAAAAKYLTSIHNNGAIKELLDYNLQRYSISIPYQYYMDRVSILTRATVSASGSSSKADKEIGVVEGKEDSELVEVRELFDLWNSLGVIKHKKLTGDMTRAIKAASRDFSAVEISQATKNYAQIVNDEQCFFKYRWTLKDFLKRGLEKFLDLEVALNNYRRGAGDKMPTADDKKGGQSGAHRQGSRRLPTKYRSPEEIFGGKDG